MSISEETQSFTTDQSLSDFPMMSEQDAQTIIRHYNQTIDTMTKENQQLRGKVEALKQLQQESDQRYTGIQKQFSEQNKRADHLIEQENVLMEQIQDVLSHKTLKDQKDFILQDILTFFPQKQEQEDSLLQFDEQPLQEDNDNFILKILRQLKELNLEKRRLAKPVECSQCHQFYNPLCNKEDSCFYHPGKMKFYSCRKCGADDYYTCCLKCQKCCDGCKYNYHTPKP